MPTAVDELARVRRRQVGEVSVMFYRWRARAASAVAIGIMSLLTLAHAPTGQLVSMGLVLAFLCGYLYVQSFRTRGEPQDDRALLTALAMTLVTMVVVVCLTGAFASPMLTFVLLPAISAFTSFGRSRASSIMLGLLLVAALALTLTTLAPPFPPIAEPARTLLAVLCIGSSTAFMYKVVTGLTDAFLDAGSALDRMRAQALEATVARTRDLEALGAKVAHEVKNPLTAVKTLVELVAADPPSERNRQRLTVAREEVERIEAFLRDYLTLARPFEELAVTPVAIGTLARDVAALLEVRAAVAEVAIACEGPPVTLDVDGRRLHAALFNLISNAVDATPRGGTVRVTWRHVAAAFEVVVYDGGSPLSDEALAKIGQPFYTTKEGGTGLGVAVARTAFAQHGGGLVYERGERGLRAVAHLPRGGAAMREGGDHG